MSSYDPGTDAGKVRLLIADTDRTDPVFDDNQITAFLDLADDDVRLAAAYALDVIANNMAMVLKVIKTLDLSTDGAATAKSLRDGAQILRDQVESDGDTWAIAEFADPPFGYQERMFKQTLRDLL